MKQQHSPNCSPNATQQDPISPVSCISRAPVLLQKFLQLSARYAPSAAKLIQEQTEPRIYRQQALAPFFMETQQRARYQL